MSRSLPRLAERARATVPASLRRRYAVKVGILMLVVILLVATSGGAIYMTTTEQRAGMETTATPDDEMSEQESPSGGLTGFVLGSYFYLLVSVVVNFQDSALIVGDNTIRLASTPDMFILQGAMLGILVLGGGLLIGLYAGHRWGWIGSLVLFGGWAIFMAGIGKLLVSGVAVVCVGYLLTRAGHFTGGPA